MGSGFISGGKLNLIISSDFGITSTQSTSWQAYFQKASDALYAATGGQLAFGKIWLADVMQCLADAEILLLRGNSRSVSGATRGMFGVREARINWYENELHQNPKRLVHDLAHHIWDLGDEYAGPFRSVTIDRGSMETRLNVIPINDTSVSDNELRGHRAIVTFGPEDRQESIITANTTDAIVLRDSLTRLAALSSSPAVAVQPLTTCVDHAAYPTANVCLMDDANLSAVTQFCTPSNHVSANPTVQQDIHGESCWKTILGHSNFSHWIQHSAPPTSAGPTIEWIRMRTASRIVLAVDVSGSMRGEKLRYTSEGLKYWVDREIDASPQDMLGIVAFDTQRQWLLPLSPAGQININRDQIIAAIDALRASSNTNIREAIRDSVAEFSSLLDVATIQAIILLTDGKHNTPAQSSILEMKQRLQDNNIKFVAVAIGSTDEVALPDLTNLAMATGGFIRHLDPGAGDGPGIEQLLIDAHKSIRGDLGEATEFEFVPAPPKRLKHTSAKLVPLYGNATRPKWLSVLKALAWKAAALPSTPAARQIMQRIPLNVEPECARMTVTINHHIDAVFDLFTLDPQGHDVSRSTSVGVRSFRGSNSHQFVTVERPVAGTWTLIVLRLPARDARLDATSLKVHLTTGMMNPKVSVSARIDRSVVPFLTPVTISASASWVRQLSEVSVFADILTPSGRRVTLPLHDTDEFPMGRGDYEAVFIPDQPGRYAVIVRFKADENRGLANSSLMLTHAKGKPVSIYSQSKPFVRVATCSFTAVKRL